MPNRIKIVLPENKLDSANKEYPYRVELSFSNFLQTVDITNFSKVELASGDAFDLDTGKNILRLKNTGYAKLKASFIWVPENLLFSDEITVVSELPGKPDFAEVIINEIFPFPSGIIPATDANMNGFARSDEDEFIELKNIAKERFNISGCRLFTGENKTACYEFSENTVIEPDKYLVVFGEQAKNKNLNLINTGTTVEFVCDEMTIDYTGYSPGKSGDPSWQRKSDFGLLGFMGR